MGELNNSNNDDVGVELMVSIRPFLSTLKISHIFL